MDHEHFINQFFAFLFEHKFNEFKFLILGVSQSDFLQLMIEQLKNQNPLEPTDASEFMSQMLSYGNYDSTSTMSDQISEMSSTLSSYLAMSSANYIGDTISAEGDTTMLSDGSASWNYDIDSKASSVTITISDQDGNTVWSGSGETSAGSHTFTWDGTDSDGNTLEDGAYTISVTAKDSSGNSIDTSTSINGKVTGIGTDDDDNSVLMIGDVAVSLEDILSVKS